MAYITRIREQDIILYALYLIKSRNKEATPYVSFAQINKYKELIINGLNEFNMNYEILPGATKPADVSFRPELKKAVEKISLNVDPQSKNYSLSKEHSEEAIFARINATTPLYIRSFFEPEGYEQLLGLQQQEMQNNQRSK